MSHLMTGGRPCGRPDGHNGKHRSVESVKRGLEANRRYRELHEEEIRGRARRYREANRDKVLESSRERTRRRLETHPDAVREVAKRARDKLKKAVLDHYGNVCACCGSTERLTIDHVNGDGDQHRAQVGRGWEMYRWLIKNSFPEGFQILCRPCNSSKRRGERCRLNHADPERRTIHQQRRRAA